MPQGTEVSATTPMMAVSPTVAKYLKEHDLPPEGVTILGGKPYVNASGLLYKAKKLGIKSIRVEVIQAATKEKPSAIAKATVEMKDGGVFEDIGYGSVDSIQMKTLHNTDYLTMTTITRAKNRALRSATGVGLVSAEEVKGAYDLYAEGGEGAPSLALPKPKPEEAAEKISEETRQQLIAQLDRLQREPNKMLCHYSKVYGRELTTVLELTEAEGQEIVGYLAGVNPKADEPMPDHPEGSQAVTESAPEAPAKAVEVEVMPPEEPKAKKAKPFKEALAEKGINVA